MICFSFYASHCCYQTKRQHDVGNSLMAAECMVTIAIHLELVLDMTTEEFLLAFKRFIAQRGTPVEIISNNAVYFKFESKTLEEIFFVWFLTTHQPLWVISVRRY